MAKTKRRRRPPSSAGPAGGQDLGPFDFDLPLVAGGWELPDLWAEAPDLSWEPTDLDFDLTGLDFEVTDLALGDLPSLDLGPWEL